MAADIPPIAPTDATAAEAGPALDKLKKLGVIDYNNLGGRWLLEILMMRTRGEISLKAAVFLTLYVLDKLGGRTPGTLWSHLATCEILGQVNCRTLTLTCLQALLQDGENLHHATIGNRLQTKDNLTRVANARRAARVNFCQGAEQAFMPWYDRVRDALLPYANG